MEKKSIFPKRLVHGT